MTHDDAIERAARSDAEFDGRDFDRLGRIDRQRYIDRSARALQAALGDGVVVPAGWRSIETAPTDGTRILYVNKFGEIGHCFWSGAASEDEEAVWWDEEKDDEVVPRYWMPALPPAPPASKPEQSSNRTEVK